MNNLTLKKIKTFLKYVPFLIKSFIEFFKGLEEIYNAETQAELAEIKANNNIMENV